MDPSRIKDGIGGWSGGGGAVAAAAGENADGETLDGQRGVVEALLEETEKEVERTQAKLELLGGELDDMCRRLSLGDSFQ
ncbi:unnamed protein product, partial [Discosporangium mesarthrocarpum]